MTLAAGATTTVTFLLGAAGSGGGARAGAPTSGRRRRRGGRLHPGSRAGRPTRRRPATSWPAPCSAGRSTCPPRTRCAAGRGGVPAELAASPRPGSAAAPGRGATPGPPTGRPCSRAPRRWRALGLPIDLTILGADGRVERRGRLRLRRRRPGRRRSRSAPDAARLVVTDRLPMADVAVRGRRRPAAGPGRRSARTAPAGPFANGHGGFSRRRPRVRHRGPADRRRPPAPAAAALDQRHRQRDLRLHRQRDRRRRHLGGQQPRAPAHPLVQRPAPAIPTARPSTCATRTAGTSGRCCPGPRPGPGGYEMRHGLGYSRVRHAADELRVTTRVFVATRRSGADRHHAGDQPGRATRRLSLFAYRRWCSAATCRDSGRLVVAERDPASGALLARNRLAGPFAGHVALAAVGHDGAAASVQGACSRDQVLGPSGDLGNPAALCSSRPRGRPRRRGRRPACFAHQVRLELAGGATTEVSFLLGQTQTRPPPATWWVGWRARPRSRSPGRRPRTFWRDGVSGLQVTTPVGRPRSHGQRLARLPDPRLPHLGPLGVLPVGRRLRVPRPAPGCRWPSSACGPSSPGRRSCCTPPTSSSRATCCTGGTRRPARGIRTRFADDLALAAPPDRPVRRQHRR